MKNLQNLLLILALFAIPMFTSWLLDIPWINAEWSRQLLVYLFMVFEMSAILFMLKINYQKLIKNP